MDPYATHLPVIEAIAPRVQRVLELGGGDYSTPAWLASKTVKEVLCLETDPGWAARLRQISDKRLRVEDAYDASKAVAGRDCIFVDCGQREDERIAALVTLAAQRPEGLIIIHDWNHAPYRQAVAGVIGEWPHLVYMQAEPWTAVGLFRAGATMSDLIEVMYGSA